MKLILPTALVTTAAIIAAPAAADAKTVVRTVCADSAYVKRSPGFIVVGTLFKPLASRLRASRPAPAI